MVKIVKKISKGDIVKAILNTVKVAGLFSTAFIAPEVTKTLADLGMKDPYARRKEIIQRSRNNLIKNGLLIKDSKGFIRLTKQGLEKLKSYDLSDYELKIPHIWDEKWRMLIFDIPEYRKSLREKIRRTLISIGFRRLQDSVWVFPYDCNELVALLKADFRVGKDLQYLIVESIENDKALKNYFNL